jgi:hypothetical protein
MFSDFCTDYTIIPDLPGKSHGEIMEAARVGFKVALESK